MRVERSRIQGVFELRLELIKDDRGHFARTFDVKIFADHGLHTDFPQRSTSFNARSGTLRGLHYQAAPQEEVKLVRCTRGKLFDVVVDLRRESDTFGHWCAFTLAPESPSIVYIPPGCAHGFQTLADATEVYYEISVPYASELARGVRWDDPTIGIRWPDHPARTMSPRDEGLPLLRDAR